MKLRFPGARRLIRWSLLTLLVLLSLFPGLWGIGQHFQPVRRGVNITGAEWIAYPDLRRLPMTRTSKETLQFFTSRGLNLFRFCFCWESLQPKLLGPLDPAAVAVVRSFVRDAHSLGAEVILDPHNYARYTHEDDQGNLTTLVIGDKNFPNSHFADFWRRMSLEFRDDPGIYAYGLMNEPHDIVTKQWEAASQAALDAIRSTGDPHLVLVPGSNYSSAHIWTMCHGSKAWIKDPLNNFAYEAHCYVDGPIKPPHSLVYEEELLVDPDLPHRALTRLGVFVDWCHENGVRGFIGEFASVSQKGWLVQFDTLLGEMDRVHMDGTAWSAGDRCLPTDASMDYVLQSKPGYEHGALPILARHGTGRHTSLLSDVALGYEIAWKRAKMCARDLRARFLTIRRWFRKLS